MRQSSVETLPSTDTVQANAIITSDLSLYRKFGRITAPKFGRGATVVGDLEACQGTEGNLHGEVSSTFAGMVHILVGVQS